MVVVIEDRRCVKIIQGCRWNNLNPSRTREVRVNFGGGENGRGGKGGKRWGRGGVGLKSRAAYHGTNTRDEAFMERHLAP